jgi:alpha-tubulin suppressor-like RCC1 family protein
MFLLACMSGLSMALKTDYSLWAWGSDEYDQLGDVTTANKNASFQIGTGYQVP